MNSQNAVQETGDVRHVVASFDNVERFEDAVDLLERSGFLRGQISMIASRDALENKLSLHYRPAADPIGDGLLPNVLFTERHDIVNGPVLAIGMPIFLGGSVNGQPIFATGGALANAALIAATEQPEEEEIDTILSRVINDTHAGHLCEELARGQLLLGLDAVDEHERDYASYLLRRMGAQSVTSHAIPLSWASKHESLDRFDSHEPGVVARLTPMPTQTASH